MSQSPHGPLAGVRVLDLTTVVMGPYATQLLGDYGADVIKVEPPEGDVVRYPGPARHTGMGHVFLNANRNKRGMVLDLKQAAGRDALLRLVDTADVFVYNVRPQALARLRLGWDDLKARNPRLIHVGGFGFGQGGPYAARPAFDDLIQAMSGAADLLGRTLDAADPVPRYVPINFCDRVSGLHLLNAILAALYSRERTGTGQAIEVPMFETMASFMLGEHLAGATFVPDEGGFGYSRILSRFRKPYATRDGWLGLLPYNDKHWRAYFEAIGRADLLQDLRFASAQARAANADAVYGFLEEVTRTRTTAQWCELLLAADVPHTPVLRIEELPDDPHLKAVGLFREYDHPTEGRLRETMPAATWSGTPPGVWRPAPRLGEHSAEVLREAGFDAAEIDDLMRRGVTRGAD